jgi:hypothetical protein
MDVSIALSIAGLLVGIAGLVVAKYQFTERNKLQQAIRAQAWSLYSKSENATDVVQLALSKYKELHAQNFNPDVLEVLAKADAFSQNMLNDTIRHIHFSEPRFDSTEIEKWKMEGKITNDTHMRLFNLFVPSEKKQYYQ